MPHKRAKRSIREREADKKGQDLAPSGSVSTEGIPKSVSRILNAAQIRGDFKEKKRAAASSEDVGPAKKRRKSNGGEATAQGLGSEKKRISIKPGESLAHFNRRVEDDMRPLVRSAMQASSAMERQIRKTEKEQSKSSKSSHRAQSPEPHPTTNDKKRKGKEPADEETDAAPVPSNKHAGKATEFTKLSTSAPRRLNDIAMAPPELKTLPRGASKVGDGLGKGAGVLSMAQRVMMERERENVIQRYRQLKAKRHAENGKSPGEE